MNGLEFKNILETLFPLDLKEDWDNVGLQLGTFNKEIENVLISLDLNMDVCEEAIENDVQLIIVHHPLIFRPIKDISTDKPIGKMIETLIKNDIALYVAHTNYDISNYGMNTFLADKLNLNVTGNIIDMTENEGLGKVGTIKKLGLNDFIKLVKDTFNIEYAKYIGKPDIEINKVAILGGSGGSEIHNANKKKPDIYLTGDVSYHHALDAKNIGLNVLDIGHYVESLYKENIKEVLKNHGVLCNLIVSEINTNPYKLV